MQGMANTAEITYNPFRIPIDSACGPASDLTHTVAPRIGTIVVVEHNGERAAGVVVGDYRRDSRDQTAIDIETTEGLTTIFGHEFGQIVQVIA